MQSSEKIGLSVFSTKKAETESWLIERAFVPPPDFEFLKGEHSVVLFGDAGAGKTASYLALEKYGIISSPRLIVSWRPQMPDKEIEMSTMLAMSQLHDILQSCAKVFMEKLSFDLSLILKAKPSTQEYLIWFLRYFFRKDFLSLMPITLPKKEKEQFTALADRYSQGLFENIPDMMIAATEFTKAMIAIGFTGVWVMVDGVDWLNDEQRAKAVKSLRSILSTLKLFEIPYLSYKMVLPSEFESELVDAIAITRDRAMVLRISWDSRYLSSILEQRLALVVGDGASFEQIYSKEAICSWLEACGGMNPRGWIEYFRPIASTYWDVASNGKSRKLTKSEWNHARSRSSLHLQFFPETNQVRVGMGAVKTLSPEVGAIFSYLYNNKGRYCTKKELYYKAYVPFTAPENKVREVSDQVALPKEYDDLINTVIYRIRQTVEPNPKDKEPVFITTKRDVGIKLSTQAFQ